MSHYCSLQLHTVGVARIFSEVVHFFPEKVYNLFSPRPQYTG